MSAFVRRGQILAVIRCTAHGPEVTRFDSTPSLRRASETGASCRRPSITWIDGSLESAGYGLGVPLAGRELTDTLDVSIRSICEGCEQHDLAKNEVNDVALSYRGRFLAVIRFTPWDPGRDAVRYAALVGHLYQSAGQDCLSPVNPATTGRADLRPDRPVHLQEYLYECDTASIAGPKNQPRRHHRHRQRTAQPAHHLRDRGVGKSSIGARHRDPSS